MRCRACANCARSLCSDKTTWTALNISGHCREMRRKLLISISLCAIAWCLGHPQTARAVEWINCDPHYRAMDLAPVGSGPLELMKVFCQRVRFDFTQVAMVSPDGRFVAYLEGGTDYAVERKILHVAPLDTYDSWTSHSLNMGALWQFGQADRSVPAYGWASNSSGVWTATRDTSGSNRISSTGLQPAFASLEGNGIRLFEPPRHTAGPLDGLLWADGDGLAVAYFGARGGSYPPPQRHDKNPTFAMVDSKRAVVLDTLPFAIFGGPDRISMGSVNNAAVTVLQNGKVRTLLSVANQWAVWTQGEPPRMLSNPYPEERHNKMAISRDGSRLLVTRLACDGGHDAVKDDGLLRRPMAPPCKPVESVIAALHDLETGRQLWEIRETVYRTELYPNPAISDDGRYALVGLPYNPPDSKVALISMAEGSIVQTFQSPGQGLPNSLGFFQGGHGVWVHSHGVTALYSIRDRAQ
ncbi:MAG: hypothetical protein JWN71_1763 [Xanthobacteraceae bacterium]|nr:hypothetical protein [Xanthobacteraceae bacterium]